MQIDSRFFRKNRDFGRSLNIRWDLENFDFRIRSPKGICGIVNINNTKLEKQMAIKQTRDRKSAVIGIKKSKIRDDIFHELVHWFHFLRDPYRFYEEGVVGKDNEEMMRIYYNWAISVERKHEAIVTWSRSFEEIRTILGIPEDSQKYLEGDDISENVFLLSFFSDEDSSFIRFGHTNRSFTENIESVLIAQEVACNAIENYTQTTVSRSQLPIESRISCIIRNIETIVGG